MAVSVESEVGDSCCSVAVVAVSLCRCVAVSLCRSKTAVCVVCFPVNAKGNVSRGVFASLQRERLKMALKSILYCKKFHGNLAERLKMRIFAE